MARITKPIFFSQRLFQQTNQIQVLSRIHNLTRLKMNVLESDNCTGIDARITTHCRFQFESGENAGEASMFSCQTGNHDRSDDLTNSSFLKHAESAFGEGALVTNSKCHPMGAWSSDVPVEQLLEKQMASNCSPDYNMRNVTGITQFTCRYLGEATVDGKQVSNPFKQWSGRIASCDGDSDRTYEDVVKLGHRMMGGRDNNIDINKVQCNLLTI